MDTQTLNEIFRVCIIPLLGILTSYLVGYLKSLKIDTQNDTLNKYLEMLKLIVAECVEATNQTYVDALKDKDAFTEEAQKEAFEKTYKAVLAILGEDATKVLNEGVGDLNTYIKNLIESIIKEKAEAKEIAETKAEA